MICEICGKEFLRRIRGRTTCSHKCVKIKYYRKNRGKILAQKKEEYIEHKGIYSRKAHERYVRKYIAEQTNAKN